jgi:hypothetical protein
MGLRSRVAGKANEVEEEGEGEAVTMIRMKFTLITISNLSEVLPQWNGSNLELSLKILEVCNEFCFSDLKAVLLSKLGERPTLEEFYGVR